VGKVAQFYNRLAMHSTAKCHRMDLYLQVQATSSQETLTGKGQAESKNARKNLKNTTGWTSIYRSRQHHRKH
jgi:hypothetical protein